MKKKRAFSTIGRSIQWLRNSYYVSAGRAYVNNNNGGGGGGGFFFFLGGGGCEGRNRVLTRLEIGGG
jgi:hypothetical protein